MNLAMKIKQLLVTISYLKYRQIYYRIFYGLRKHLRTKLHYTYKLTLPSTTQKLLLNESIKSFDSLDSLDYYKFNFLNKTYIFSENIDWNFSTYGKLWTYNLNYFDYLVQVNIDNDLALMTIYDFIDNIDVIKDGLEPFPISLRGINWIKYISKNNLNDTKIDNSLYAQYKILMDNIEYHLLGNHLLENGFSLLFAAYYFKDTLFYKKAKKILTEELEEQILQDGGHFELSPMYHQIMLFRLLDCINLLQNNHWKDKALLIFLQKKAEIMLGWLEIITFKNGDIPLLNDSTNGIAPTTKALFEYASRLNVVKQEQKLSDSGYRKFANDKYECVVDMGNIGPDYIPGHAHADTFSFVLYLEEIPFIIDAGLSTYETNKCRTYERSTSAHNTVEVNSTNQSNVWGGFRVAERAHIVSLHENDKEITATHNGYMKNFSTLHARTFKFEENSIIVIDDIIAKDLPKTIARLHFHPNVDENMIYKHINLHELDYSIKEYLYATEFNKHIKSKMIEINFSKKLEIRIAL